MPSEKLTPKRLEKLVPPRPGVVDELQDTVVRGLSLRVFSSGRASWTLRYRPKGGGARRRITLGEFPNIKLTEARRRAELARGEVSGGGDPQGVLSARRQAPTLSTLIDRYLEEVERKKSHGPMSYTNTICISSWLRGSGQRKPTRLRRRRSRTFIGVSAKIGR